MKCQSTKDYVKYLTRGDVTFKSGYTKCKCLSSKCTKFLNCTEFLKLNGLKFPFLSNEKV